MKVPEKPGQGASNGAVSSRVPVRWGVRRSQNLGTEQNVEAEGVLSPMDTFRSFYNIPGGALTRTRTRPCARAHLVTARGRLAECGCGRGGGWGARAPGTPAAGAEPAPAAAAPVPRGADARTSPYKQHRHDCQAPAPSPQAPHTRRPGEAERVDIHWDPPCLGSKATLTGVWRSTRVPSRWLAVQVGRGDAGRMYWVGHDTRREFLSPLRAALAAALSRTSREIPSSVSFQTGWRPSHGATQHTLSPGAATMR